MQLCPAVLVCCAYKNMDAHSRDRKMSQAIALGARVPQAELYDMLCLGAEEKTVDRSEFSTCFKVLEDTIQKKEQYLDELLALTKEQEQVLLQEKFSMDAFESLMDRKDPYIKKISEFDAGFESVYERMRPEMEGYKKEFEPRIRALQGKIKTVLEKGAALCTSEEQNKTRLEFCLRDKKQEIKNFNKSSRTVSSYYKNMSGALSDKSFFMDKKK